MNSFSPRSRPPWAKRSPSFAAVGSIWNMPMAVTISDLLGRVRGGVPTTNTPLTWDFTELTGMPPTIPGYTAVAGD
jgi:hypothetical protein